MRIKSFLKKEIVHEILLILIILLISALVEMKIYRTIPQVQHANDTITYEETNIDWRHGIVDDSRTPVYPILIRIFVKIVGYDSYKYHLIRLQKILFLVGLVFLFLTVQKLTNNKIIASVVSLFFGMSPLLFFWTTFILTESIALFEIILLAFLTISYLKKPKIVYGITMMATVIITIMTRPAFIYLLPIYLLFCTVRFFTNKEERKQVIAGLISSLVVILILLGYCALVKKCYGSFSLTAISNYNNTLTAINSGLYKNGGNEEIIQKIDEMMGGKTEGIEIWDTAKEIDRSYPYNEVNEFIGNALSGKQYYLFLINKCLRNASSPLTESYINNTVTYQNISSILTPFTFGSTYLICFFAIIYLLVNMIKNKKIDWIVAFFTAIIFSNTFVLMVGAPFEERRLALPSIPMLYLLTAFVIGIFFEKKHEEKNEENNKNVKDLIKKDSWFRKLFIEKTDDTKIQFLRYLFVGGIAAVVNVGAFTLLNKIMDYRVANVIAFTLGLLTNYLLSKKLVFAKEKSLNKYAEFAIYAIIGVLGLLWDTLIIGFSMNVLEIMDLVSKIISTGIVFIWNFGARKIMYVLINKFIINKKDNEGKEEKTDE